MTWHETIAHIRQKKEYKQLVTDAYFSENLMANVERYKATEEFKETLRELKKLDKNKGCRILDLGAGNGISTIAFALAGFDVTALEPDPSESIGAGAILKLKEQLKLNNIAILECYAEDIPKNIQKFDVVFARQSMHHAYHLENFVAAAYAVLNPLGILMTVRDHVVKSKKEKEIFLERHPLHKFYGGENAFSKAEYSSAMIKAGFKILKIYKPSETVINYHPWSKERLKQKLGFFAKIDFIVDVAWNYLTKRWDNMPGCLHTFVAQKQ